MPRIPLRVIVAAALLSIAQHAGALNTCRAGVSNIAIAESTPSSAFTDNGDETVTHNLTGLMWRRCEQGRSGATCATGIVETGLWIGALPKGVTDTTGGHTDWRLPNKKELESIVEICGSSPAINQNIFPNTPAVPFWSSSSYTPNTQAAWVVDFDTGQSTTGNKAFAFNHVRLVRGGNGFGSFDARNQPSLDVDGNGTADPYTDGLMIIRYLFGLRGAALIQDAVGAGAKRTTATQIGDYIESVIGQTKFDIDGNAISEALTDGLLAIRYMLGLRDTALVQGAVGPAPQRNTSQIQTHLQSLMP